MSNTMLPMSSSDQCVVMQNAAREKESAQIW